MLPGEVGAGACVIPEQMVVLAAALYTVDSENRRTDDSDNWKDRTGQIVC